MPSLQQGRLSVGRAGEESATDSKRTQLNPTRGRILQPTPVQFLLLLRRRLRGGRPLCFGGRKLDDDNSAARRRARAKSMTTTEWCQ
uniref:Uncharacterized protein n=1 Tax=Arundo donax TaxID=35708 RepID=A0A0A9GNC9_ARUDO